MSEERQIRLADIESGIFATPKDLGAIQDWIEKHPKEDRISLYTVMGMTCNVIAKYIREDAFEDVDAASVNLIEEG